VRLIELVHSSAGVARSRGRNTKRALLARTLAALGPSEVALGASYLVGQLRQGRIGIGPSAIRDAARTPPAAASTLMLGDVDAMMERVRALGGKGAGSERRRLLRDLFSRATAEEQEFLVRLLQAELRQGAVEGVMVESIAEASGCTPREVRRAVAVSGNLARVAAAALQSGSHGLTRFRLELGQPVHAMLAQTAADVESAVAALRRAVLDFKMDGARVQVHKHGADVAVFSRRLNDVSASVPEIVEAVAALPSRRLVLDGEAIALDAHARPLPFQTTMRRFGRTQDLERMRQRLPLSVFFFDCLHADGEDLLDAPTDARLAALDATVRGDSIMPRIVTSDAASATAFLARALQAGHEGVMAKDPAAPYEAGNRGSAWLKIKSAHTLDLVVLAAEWGSGRRSGWLSNLHLGARDSASGKFVMLGKTFKGLTDEMLAWQTQALLEREIARDEYTVYVRPEIVVEITFNDVQTSPQYPAGLALRFARVKAFRRDKEAHEADTIETVRALHHRSG
jgi:DNA ligase 1